jgi:hypothetical protein
MRSVDLIPGIFATQFTSFTSAPPDLRVAISTRTPVPSGEGCRTVSGPFLRFR